MTDPTNEPTTSAGSGTSQPSNASGGADGDNPGSRTGRSRRRGGRGRGRRGRGETTTRGETPTTRNEVTAARSEATAAEHTATAADGAPTTSRGTPRGTARSTAHGDEDAPTSKDAAGDARRRRRGRRGRGRGAGGDRPASPATTPETSSADTAGEAPDTRPLFDGVTDGTTAADPASPAAPETDAADTGRTPPSGDTGDEREVAAAIARGGTRMAAKSGRAKRTSPSGTGGGGGGGRGRQPRIGGVSEEVRRAILEGPPRTMLVTNREDRTQIAVLEDRTVVEHYVTRKKDVTFVGNIYMARVQNVLPGMEAAFLDIGKGRNGVLYAGEVLYDELDLEEGADQRIENVLKPGQKVLVQVTKDPMGSKGPRLTMHLSLAGRYSVLAPSSELFGISRKLTDRERDRLRRIVKKVKPEHHGVIVRTAAENASEDQLTADLERLLRRWEKVEKAAANAKALTPVYEEPPLVVKVIRDNFGPEFERCIVDDEDLYQQVRGYLDEVAPELTAKVELYGQPTTDARARAAGAPAPEDASADPATADAAAEVPAAEAAAVVADTTPTADTASGDGEATEPEGAEEPADDPSDAADEPDAEEVAEDRRDATDDAGSDEVAVVATVVDLEAARARRATLPGLFDAYDVTDQLRKATARKVWLPSGGYLVIESTEAMKVIDVNSGKFTGDGDMNLEEVVLRTNLEAAEEIVRQLRLRDMGGIIVIDFIDMLLKANQDQVVRRLKRELLRDRTKTRVSEVSRLGLVQMTRKNVSQGLVEAFSHTCEACEGRGLISELD